MRIITGKAKGVKLETLDGMSTRPTSDRTKEAIFSSIQFDIEGRAALDLFAGSGQMGLEALSRGAKKAVFIDSSDEAIKVVKANAKKTGFFEMSHFLISDYRNYIRKASGKEAFDIIFIDPPYGERIVPEVLARLTESKLCNPHCILICESEEDITTSPLPNMLQIIKNTRYGRAHICILSYKPTLT